MSISSVYAKPKIRFHIDPKCPYREEIKAGVKELNRRSTRYKFIHRKRRSFKVYCNAKIKPLGVAYMYRHKAYLSPRATTEPKKAAYITIHELFHLLWIEHQSTAGSVMNPYFYGVREIPDSDIFLLRKALRYRKNRKSKRID